MEKQTRPHEMKTNTKITLKARRAISKYNKAKQHYESQNTNTPT